MKLRVALPIAAMGTLLLLAGPARATPVQFQIVSNASPLTTVFVYRAGGTSTLYARFGDVVSSYGEPNPSNTAYAVGNFSADITPGVSIAFQTGANITFPSTFNYLPSTVPAQFGFEISLGTSGLGGPFSNGGYGYASLSGMTLGFGDTACAFNGGGVLAYVGANSYAGNNNALCSGGGVLQFSSSALGTGGSSAGGVPFGFSSPNSVTFDGTTIVIPVSYSVDRFDAGQLLRITTSGTVVAQVIPIPEPSSLLLVGLGTLALAGRVQRRRH